MNFYSHRPKDSHKSMCLPDPSLGTAGGWDTAKPRGRLCRGVRSDLMSFLTFELVEAT